MRVFKTENPQHVDRFNVPRHWQKNRSSATYKILKSPKFP